jgi:hypothetical protein
MSPRSPSQTIHVYNRRDIMRRAHEIARETRLAAARETFDLDVRVVGARIIHNRPLSAHIAATPANFSAAMKQAWAEAKHAPPQASRALSIVTARPGALAPLRRLRIARVFRLMSTVAHWIGSRFIPSRAA